MNSHILTIMISSFFFMIGLQNGAWSSTGFSVVKLADQTATPSARPLGINESDQYAYDNNDSVVVTSQVLLADFGRRCTP